MLIVWGQSFKNEMIEQFSEYEVTRNELLHGKLEEYFAELCDLWDIEFIEVTEQGEDLMRQIAEKMSLVTHEHLVLGPPTNSNLN